MTDKQIIKLKPIEDLNKKIIKEKGNTKCIFYGDDICRKGDRTRDCINCARVEYHQLYSLNWDNQERLQEKLKQEKQKYEKLKKENENLKKENENLKNAFKELDTYIEKAKDWLKNKKTNDFFLDEISNLLHQM